MDQADQNTQTNTSPEKSSSSSTVKIIVAVVVVVALAFAVWQFGLKKDTEEVESAETSVIPTNSQDIAPTEAMMAAPTYQDGEYEITGEYQTPASLEELDFKFTIENGLITAAEFTGTPDNATTKLMQGKFNDGFEAEVVGKSIDEISLTVVNGSSLTPKGFMDALNKLKEEAKG